MRLSLPTMSLFLQLLLSAGALALPSSTADSNPLNAREARKPKAAPPPSRTSPTLSSWLQPYPDQPHAHVVSLPSPVSTHLPTKPQRKLTSICSSIGAPLVKWGTAHDDGSLGSDCIRIDGDNYVVQTSWGSGPWTNGHTVRVCFFHDDACQKPGKGFQTSTGWVPECMAMVNGQPSRYGWERESYKSARFDPSGSLCKLISV